MDLPETPRNEKLTNENSIIEKYIKLPHPKTFETGTLIVILATSVLGSIIGLELIVRLA